MPLTENQIQTANQMASEGYTIEAIRKRLGLPDDGGWHEVAGTSIVGSVPSAK